MNTKDIVSSLLFVLVAATSSLALAQTTGDSKEIQSSTFPYTPVGNPNIE